jgi:hypothetical protein
MASSVNLERILFEALDNAAGTTQPHRYRNIIAAAAFLGDDQAHSRLLTAVARRVEGNVETCTALIEAADALEDGAARAQVFHAMIARSDLGAEIWTRAADALAAVDPDGLAQILDRCLDPSNDPKWCKLAIGLGPVEIQDSQGAAVLIEAPKREQ